MNDRPRGTPPPLPPEAIAEGARSTPAPAAAQPNASIVMNRADEILHVQELVEKPVAHIEPIGRNEMNPVIPTGKIAKRSLPIVQVLKLTSGIAAIVAALAWSYPAVRNAIRSFHAPRASHVPTQPIVISPTQSEKSAPGITVVDLPKKSQSLSLMVDSRPAGASVIANGARQGQTPTLINLDCVEGATFAVRVYKNGFKPQEQQVTCRADTFARINLTLQPLE